MPDSLSSPTVALVGLTRWRDANKDPMPHSWTRHVAVAVSEDGVGWTYHNVPAAHGRIIARHFHRAYWCDPVPPVEGALTLDHLRVACDEALGDGLEQHDWDDVKRAVALIRRAIADAERGGQP